MNLLDFQELPVKFANHSLLINRDMSAAIIPPLKSTITISDTISGQNNKTTAT
jgi:hypothetical protein